MTDKEMAEVLRHCNQIRVAVNAEPIEAIPPGVPGRATQCPIALALKNGVRPEVSDWKIELHFRAATSQEELDAVADNLRKIGYQCVTVNFRTEMHLWGKRRGRAHRVRIVGFRTPKVMAKFIGQFDKREIKHLIRGSAAARAAA